jgi:2-phosphoglycerate kinase
MNHDAITENRRAWGVLIIGGASGTGKTSVSYRLARHFDVGITEVDDLHIVLERLTTPEQQPVLHYWRTNPEAAHLSAEQILELHIAVSRVLSPAIAAVIANHIETQTPIVLEGDYLLPEMLARRDQAASPEAERVKGVWLYEPDEMQIVQNYALREPAEGEQAGRARVSWLYGQWLKEECERYGLAALPSRPWNTLHDRIREAIA